MLRESSKTFVVSENASPVNLEDLTILKSVKIQENSNLFNYIPKILTWNLQFGRSDTSWNLESVVKLSKEHDICFFQEIPNDSFTELSTKLDLDFWLLPQISHGAAFSMLTAIKKRQEAANPWICSEVEYEGQIRALIAKPSDSSSNLVVINVHLPADAPNVDSEAKRLECMSLINEHVKTSDCVWLAGDLNCADLTPSKPCHYRDQAGKLLKEISKIELKILKNCFGSTYHWCIRFDAADADHNWKEVDFICSNMNLIQTTCTLFNPPTHECFNDRGKHYPITNRFSSERKVGIAYTCDGKSFLVEKLKFTGNSVSGDISPRPKPYAYLHGESVEPGFKITQKSNQEPKDILFLRKYGKIYNRENIQVGSWNWV